MNKRVNNKQHHDKRMPQGIWLHVACYCLLLLTTGYTYSYNSFERSTTATEQSGRITKFKYDLNSNLIRVTDKRNIVTETQYDKEDRPTVIIKDGVTISTTEYDEVGNKEFVTDANGNKSAYLYDPRNLVTTESLPLAAVTTHEYDSMGDRNQTRDPEGRITKNIFDLRRRLENETNGELETTSYEHDGNGNRTSMRRPNGNTWTYSYDGANRLKEVIDPLLGKSSFTYDKNGNRESQTDANLKITTYEYDELDRKTATIYPDTARQEYDYDENGNLIRLLDPKGQEITYQYDELNRQTLHTYPLPTVPTGDDIQTIATSYDPNNNPKEVTETYTGVTGTRVTSNQYDTFDRLISTTDAFGKSINYTYDANGNRKTVKDPDDNITRYSYDALNRVETVTNSGGVTSYSYDRSSLKTKITYPNGTDALYSYDDAYRIETINNRHNGITVSSYSYTFDDNGNRKTQIETNGGAAETTSYDYDDNDRLEQVTYPDVITTYTYDAAYNRKTEISEDRFSSATLVNKTYNYNDRNQLETVIDNLDNSQNVTYQYDDNGNRVIKTKNGVTNTFIYDVRDKLIELRQDAATLGNYFYDYKGMRVIKTDAGGEVRYTYDGESVLTQSDNTNTTIAKYDYGPDRLLSLDHNTEGRQFYLFDALGSTVNLTKTDGSLQARYQYDAWGHYRSQAGASWNRFAFTGHEKDEESGLYYFKARYYDPDTGGFLSQDAYLGEAGTPPSLHRYLYAYSNPNYFLDLTGYAATPYYSKPLTDQAVQIQPIGTIDTGSQFVDNVLAGGASLVNAVITIPNGFLNGVSLPSRAGAALTGRTVEQFDNEVIATTNSMGPAGLLIQTGTLPFRATARYSKAAATKKLNKLNRTKQHSTSSSSARSDVPDIPVSEPTVKVTTESQNLGNGVTDQQMIDAIVTHRVDTKASGKSTFSVGQAGDGTVTPIRESIPGETKELDIHAEIQTLKDLEGKPKPHTIAVDQTPCSKCAQKLHDTDTRTIVPQDVNTPKRAVKNSAVKASEGKASVVPREIDLEKPNN